MQSNINTIILPSSGNSSCIHTQRNCKIISSENRKVYCQILQDDENKQSFELYCFKRLMIKIGFDF